MTISEYLKDLTSKFSLIKIIRLTIVLILLIYLIDKFNLFTNFILPYSVIYILFTVGLISVCILELEIATLFKFKIVNVIDFYLISIIISSAMITITYFIQGTYKFPLFLIILLITFLITFMRKNFLGSFKKKESESTIKSETNVLDLRDIIDGKFPEERFTRIYLSEKSVDYDLLHRQKTILDLTLNIKECHLEDQYVFSLVGKWGSGKTTIINNVKNNLSNVNDLIIIDNFNPWIYDSEETLLVAMIKEVLKKLNINCKAFNLDKYVYNLVSVIFKKNTNINYLDEFFSNDNDSLIFKNLINEYLTKENKRILFIIDNVERSKPENILMILKCIHNIMDFKRTIYLISYDHLVMDKIFNQYYPFDMGFMEKIVQEEIKVPLISEDIIKELYRKCIENLLVYYGNNKSLNSNEELVNIGIDFYSQTKNIRNIKRNINSFLSSTVSSNNFLNKADYMVIQYIFMNNSKLYNSIIENGKYYVSEDTNTYNKYWSFDSNNFNSDCHKYFTETFSEVNNKEFIKILGAIFPNVKKFMNYSGSGHPDYRINSIILNNDKTDNINSNKYRRIFNAKFFQLYFTPEEDGYINVYNKVENFVEIINDLEIKETLKREKFYDLINLFEGKHQEIIIQTLEYFIDNIKDKSLIFDILYSGIRVFNVEDTFMVLSAKSRSEFILSKLIIELTKEDFEKVLDNIFNNYKNIGFIRNLLYWLKPKENQNIDTSEIYNIINDRYNLKLEEMKSYKINIYDNKFYERYNIYCFESIKLENLDYIKSLVNESNIIKFISDNIGSSHSSNGKYYYKIENEEISKYISLDEIDNFLKKVKPLNEKEELILKIYEENKSNKEDDYLSVHGYESTSILDLDLTK